MSFDKGREKYAAYIWVANKKKHLGYFWNAQLAANAYNDAAKRHFGENNNIKSNNSFFIEGNI